MLRLIAAFMLCATVAHAESYQVCANVFDHWDAYTSGGPGPVQSHTFFGPHGRAKVCTSYRVNACTYVTCR